MDNLFYKIRIFTNMDLADLKVKEKMEKERDYQKIMNGELLKWEKENKTKVKCVNVPLLVRDNPAKIINEAHLWFENVS